MVNFIDAETYKLITKNIPIVCVELLILKEGKLLLLKRNNPPARGQWWFPGGRVFKNESLGEATVRKGKEELGITLEPQKIISVEESIFTLQNDEVDVHTINIVFQMNMVNAEHIIQLDANHTEYKWFSEINFTLHSAVKNPLMKIDFTCRED